jgi:ferrous iron transport protein B
MAQSPISPLLDAPQEEKSCSNVVLLGNPNTGKSTIFNALSGIHQKTGNYPGVTIEKRTGRFHFENESFDLVDLPGTYSLAPHTPDEMLSVNVLLGNAPQQRPPDIIVCVVDASNLERNLFLTSQLLELQQPMVIALNMTDVATRSGISIDVAGLSRTLGVPVVPVQAKRRRGIEELKRQIANAVQSTPHQHDPFKDELKERIERLERACPADCKLRRFVLTRMLFDTDGYMVRQMRNQVDGQLLKALQIEQEQMKSDGSFAESESNARYHWIQNQLQDLVHAADSSQQKSADRLDRWLTHPVWGLVIATGSMVLLFQLIFWAAEPASAAIDWLTGVATLLVDRIFMASTGGTEGALYSLIVNGLIAGVGGVLVFLPQIMLLFLILAILEDSGYLARLAFLTDRFLARIGLSGITLIPLLSSFACAIPGIMATRVIKNERERLITILVAPLMSCSARLPVYALLIAAFVPTNRYFGFGLQGLTMFAMYLVGIVVAIVVAWILKNTILRSGTSSFVMELPTYKMPSLRNVWLKTYEGGAAFVKDAGTIIVAATIVVWAAAYFPRDAAMLPAGLLDQQTKLTNQLSGLAEDSSDYRKINEQLGDVSNQINAQYLRNSFLGRAGHWIEPVVKPLGWDWRIGSAAIASFPAREVVVSTMGVLFGLGEDVDEQSTQLRHSLKNATWDGSDRKLFGLPVALSIMVFFALCAQCSSTLAVIKRETKSWRWPVFTFAYMTTLAYFAALLTFQISNYLIN